MENTLQPKSFLPNFERFLPLAVNLRDLRLDIIFLIYQSAGPIEFILNLRILIGWHSSSMEMAPISCPSSNPSSNILHI